MTIGTGDAVEKFGTQSAITNAGVTINSGAMSAQGDAVAWTNSDDATDADVLMEATFGAAPSANTAVTIYARKLNVRGANDQNQPSITNNEEIAIGSFQLDAGATGQVQTERVELPNGKASQEYEFYFKNGGGQNITSAQFWITPVSVGPAA